MTNRTLNEISSEVEDVQSDVEDISEYPRSPDAKKKLKQVESTLKHISEGIDEMVESLPTPEETETKRKPDR